MLHLIPVWQSAVCVISWFIGLGLFLVCWRAPLHLHPFQHPGPTHIDGSQNMFDFILSTVLSAQVLGGLFVSGEEVGCCGRLDSLCKRVSPFASGVPSFSDLFPFFIPCALSTLVLVMLGRLLWMLCLPF